MHIGLRRIFFIGPILICISAFLGCGHSRTVAALVEADSLMWTRPDSSLALVRSVSPDTLDDENRAYHALLLTQAQFRNNIYPDTDTIINRALDFYADNHNRERLTRSLFYKGCLLKKLGRYTDAIQYLLIAEEYCDSTDYRMLGMINLHQGDVYLLRYSNDAIPIEKHAKALKYFVMIGDSSKMCLCYGMIGGLYRMADKKKAVSNLTKAIDIAEDIKDSTYLLEYTEYLLRHYLLCKDISNAVKVKDKYLSKYNSFNNDLLLDFSYLYALRQMPDSSSYYMDYINNQTLNEKEESMRIKVMVALLAAKGNYKSALDYQSQFLARNDSLFFNNDKIEIATVESQNANARKNDLLHQLKSSKHFSIRIITLCLIIAVLTIITAILYRRQRKINKTTKELYDLLLQDKVNEHEELSTQLNQNIDLKLLLDRHVNLMKTLVGLCSLLPENIGLKLLREAMGRGFNSKLVSGLIQFVNVRHDNILIKLADLYPSLTRSNIELICLSALDFSDSEIALILGYKENSIRVIRRRLEKELNYNGKFKDLLKKDNK